MRIRVNRNNNIHHWTRYAPPDIIPQYFGKYYEVIIQIYFFNKCPARVFPGDILTYSVGALIACMAILGNFERIAVFVFIPYILETILKVRGGLPQSFGKPQKDNSLKPLYNKIYGLTHLSIFLLSKFKNKVYEQDVTYLIFIFQIIICLLALIIFKNYIFI